jgi:hypothetical protein
MSNISTIRVVGENHCTVRGGLESRAPHEPAVVFVEKDRASAHRYFIPPLGTLVSVHEIVARGSRKQTRLPASTVKEKCYAPEWHPDWPLCARLPVLGVLSLCGRRNSSAAGTSVARLTADQSGVSDEAYRSSHGRLRCAVMGRICQRPCGLGSVARIVNDQR